MKIPTFYFFNGKKYKKVLVNDYKITAINSANSNRKAGYLVRTIQVNKKWVNYRR